MGQVHKIKRGLNIRLVGEADKVVSATDTLQTVLISPEDFFGSRPKTMVNVGDEVLAGTPLMYDKNNDAYKICSPVSGEVVEIVRGDKRKLLGIKILADKETRYKHFEPADVEKTDAESLVSSLCESGMWSLIRMRPYNAVAFPVLKPKAVFVSAFDSAPMAPDMDFVINGQEREFETGLKLLGKISGAKVYLGIHNEKTVSPAFTGTRSAEVHRFSGPHPAGLVSTQIGCISPINRGETIWTVSTQDVISLGRFILTGKFDVSRLVAMTGSGLKNRGYVRTVPGANMESLVGADNLNPGNWRWISGNVLSGKNVGPQGYLSYYDHQVSIIPEGGEPEFFGWIAPGFNKLSVSRTFFSWLQPNKQYNLNTNMNGELRNFVVTGEYEKVFPLDVMPVQLLKAVLAEDIDLQEQLGIYEVVPEDFALCEFVCTSKIESQAIIEKGLLRLYEELVDSLKPAEHHHG